MDAGGKQRFIGIDVPNASDKRLIEKQRLDMSTAPVKALKELRKSNGQRIRSDARKRTGHLREEFDAPELANIVIEQGALVQMKNGTRVLAGSGIDEQLARHPKMDEENATVEFEKDLFAMAADTLNQSTCYTRDCGGEITARDPAREKLNVPNRAAKHIRGNGAYNRLYFRKFRQVCSYHSAPANEGMDEHLLKLVSGVVGPP